MNNFFEFLEDINSAVWRYAVSDIKKCNTSGCNKNAVLGEEICIKCISVRAEIQQAEVFPKILESLERIESVLSSSTAIAPGEIKKIDKMIEERQNVFIPSIDVSEPSIQSLNEKKTVVAKNVSQIAKHLNSMNKED